MSSGNSTAHTIRRVIFGKRTLIFFGIFFTLGVILPMVLNITSLGGGDVGFPYPFYHDEGSIPGGRTWTEWDVFATNLAVYYGLAVVMGLIPVLRKSS